MKKIYVTLALILCLVICAFAFASCGPKKPASTTAKGTEPATTTGTTDGTCQHVWGEFEVDTPATCTAPGSKSKYCTLCDVQDPDSITEIPQLAHTPADEFSIDKEPTCSEGGSKSKHCTVCGNPIPDTVQPIDPDPTKHNVEHWNVTEAVNLFHTTGSRNGECTDCHQPIVEVLHFQPTVLEISADDNYVVKSSYQDEILGSDKHFYPTTENILGDDLFIEFSILWNHTLPDNCTGVMKTGNCGANFKSNNVTTSWMAICDNDSDSWCPYAGGFEGCDLGTVDFGPPKMVTEKATYADYPNFTGAVEGSPEWGWHRVAIQVHQDVTNADALKNDGVAGATQALYKLTATYYFDGVKVAQLSYSGDGKSNGGYWQSGGGTKMEKGLFTAQSDGEGGITYKDCYENNAPFAFIAVVGKATNADNPGYLVLGDVSFTCGTDPVQSVERVNAPAGDPTYTIVEGVEVPAKVYFKLAD